MLKIVKNEILTYSVYENLVKELGGKYSSLKITTCGKSLLGKELFAFVIGEGKGNIVYVGGTHGIEWLTSLLLLKFTENLVFAYENEKTISGFDVREILKNKKIIIIPELNPDGIEISLKGASACGKYKVQNFEICKGDFSFWSANARGVDINHNFNADWYTLREAEKEAGIDSPSPSRYGGLFPESEPETSAITKLCRGISVDMLITFHSQGEEIFYEYGKNTPEKSLHIAKIFSALTDYTLVKNEGLYASGGLKDWFIEEFNRPAFTIEIGKGKNPLPVDSINQIYEKLEAMMVVGMLF
ncbi:MAG: gamma-D-glutamyl-meso-diaminopimelate peptidase [Clostridia bacterium]|nr:gamma-D-glutamyl-meso-diaminopimelate peptidase [Clostridia bacterium]